MKQLPKSFPVTILLIVCLAVFAFSAVAQASVDFAPVEAAIMQGHYDVSEKLAGKMILQEDVTDGDMNQALCYLGVSYLKQDDFTRAEEVFGQVVAGRPEVYWRDRAYLGLYDVYYAQGKYEEALAAVEKLFESSPRTEFVSLADFKAARAHLKLAHWAKARDRLEDVVRSFPKSFETPYASQLLEEKQYFAVQVGAFSERERAESLSRKLQQSGEYAYIIETTDQNNTKFYRVRVGQLAKLDQAETLRVKLSEQGYPAVIYP